MTIPIKHSIKINPIEAQEVELFFAAGTMRKKIRKSDSSINTLLNTLEDYINGAIIQQNRICQNRKLLDDHLIETIRKPLNIDNPNKLSILLLINFLDIHYYTICIDKIEKLYRKLLKLLSPLGKDATHSGEIRKINKIAEKRFSTAVHRITEIRNYLEHIDNKIRDGNYDGFYGQTNDNGSWFTFGKGDNKVEVEISQIEEIKQAYGILIDYINALPESE